jgi:serine/threonine protein kinase/predicted esterase
MGRGGMGVVYRAQDEKLQRTVALKFLSPDLITDSQAKQRFVREAQVVSSLDHPNICTIFEIDETPDGRLFMVMACYEGESLRQRIDRNPIPVAEATELMIQLADGLSKAHQAGIVHRDIKPSNLFITRENTLKILDFGLARHFDQTGLTQTGQVVGTIAYISPEQLKGAEADIRSDIWAAGIVFYEMLCGRRPFHADNPAAIVNSILNRSTDFIDETLLDKPNRVRQIVSRMLMKDPAERFASAEELRLALIEFRTQLSPARPIEQMMNPPLRHRKARIILAGAMLGVVVLSAGWMWRNAHNVRWARDVAIPEVTHLVERGSYPEAFALAQRALLYAPDDPMLRTLRPKFAESFSLKSTPESAEVYVSRYENSEGEWELLGHTPLNGVSLPRRPYRWKFVKAGFEPVERATTDQADELAGSTLDVTLFETGKQQQGMVFVPGGPYSGRFNGAVLNRVDVPPFFIDRNEVTNKEFKEFVDAGGYNVEEFWKGLDFVKNGAHISLADAKKEFVDTTQRPGPAGWELGTYLKDQAELPVTGVSWYEAMAYAHFRGKSLPTLYHWGKASLPDYEFLSSLASLSVPLSNFSGTGPIPVGTHGMGPYGTFDMLGNAREWVSNRAPDGGYLLGGGWSDAPYEYNTTIASPLIERSKTNGFRLMKEVGNPGDDTLRQVIQFDRKSIVAIKPVSDEVFESYRSQFAYVRGPGNKEKPLVLETTEDWIKQKVTIETGYRNEKMDVFLFIPARMATPFQAVVFFPGIDRFLTKTSSKDIEPGFPPMPLDHIVKSGRVLVEPIFQGSYERWSPLDVTVQGGYIQKVADWRWDLGQTLDYLESRTDIDASKFAFVGLSFGASYALPAMALEPRFKTAIFLSGGEPNQVLPPLVDPIHYLPRIKIPVLLLNGGFDPIFPVAEQEMFYNALGTRAQDKRYKVFPESSHAFFPRREYLRETLDWLDKYLGRTN